MPNPRASRRSTSARSVPKPGVPVSARTTSRWAQKEPSRLNPGLRSRVEPRGLRRSEAPPLRFFLVQILFGNVVLRNLPGFDRAPISVWSIFDAVDDSSLVVLSLFRQFRDALGIR